MSTHHRPAASDRQMMQQGDTARVTAAASATDTITKSRQDQEHDDDDLIARLFGEDGVDNLDDISSRVDNSTSSISDNQSVMPTTETRETAPGGFVPHPVMLAQHMSEETRDQWPEAVDHKQHQHQATLPSAGAPVTGGDCHPFVVGVSSSTNAAVAAVGAVGKKQHQPRKRRVSSIPVNKVSTGSSSQPPPACNNKSSKVPRISGPRGANNSGGNSVHDKVKLGAVAVKCPPPPRPNTTSKVSQGNHHHVLQPLPLVPHHHHHHHHQQQQQQKPTTATSTATTNTAAAVANSNPPRSLY